MRRTSFVIQARDGDGIWISAIVVLSMETYFELVWSRFSTNDEGVWNFSKLLIISCKNVSSASFFAPAGISTLPVVPVRLTKLMRWNRILAQIQFRNYCTWLSSWSGCLSTKASAAAMATAVLTTPPLDLVFFKKVWIILSSPPRSNGLPLFFWFDDLAGWSFLGSLFQGFYLKNKLKLPCFHFFTSISSNLETINSGFGITSLLLVFSTFVILSTCVSCFII